jgi:hypothetical protein
MCDNGQQIPPGKMLPHGSGQKATGKDQHDQGKHTPATGKQAPPKS